MIAPLLRRDADLLVGLAYSPWTERVRLALDVLERPYVFVEHVPMVIEPLVRLRARRLGGRFTVPLWIPRVGESVVDSMAIVRSIDRDRRLFPEGQDEAIAGWERLSQEACDAFRGRVVARTAASPAAQEASLPPFVPRALRPHLRGVTTIALHFFRLKYDAHRDDDAPVVRALDALRKGLSAGKRHLIGDQLSYADLAMASLLQGVTPVEDRYLPLSAPLRDVWRDDRLAGVYSELVAWRDALYAEHRHPLRE